MVNIYISIMELLLSLENLIIFEFIIRKHSIHKFPISQFLLFQIMGQIRFITLSLFRGTLSSVHQLWPGLRPGRVFALDLSSLPQIFPPTALNCICLTQAVGISTERPVQYLYNNSGQNFCHTPSCLRTLCSVGDFCWDISAGRPTLFGKTAQNPAHSGAVY